MRFFPELEQQVDILRDALGDDLDTTACPATILALGDDTVVRVLEAASALVKAGEAVRIAAAGVAAARSTRDAGHKGLAQSRGHRSPVALVQEITGSTRADAAKQVRLGEALLDAGAPGTAGDVGVTGDAGALAGSGDAGPLAGLGDAIVAAVVRPWHAGLGDALLCGAIGSAQHDAILRGLGQPPALDPSVCGCIDGGDAALVDATTCECACRENPDPREGPRECACAIAENAAARDAWSAAADHLIGEAASRTVEELGKASRSIRDVLDPYGAQRRFDERFEGRAFRTWTDSDGIHHGSIRFDDLGYAWMRAIQDTALRPRRGGPRFVDPDEKSRAEQLAADPRTNDQLAYDLLLDTLRAGSLADAESVFGSRQAGVRIVVTADARATDATGAAVAVLEEGETLPASLAAQHICVTGTVECSLDRQGNPLYLGRESRTFSPKQNLALALRDGGCVWTGCDRPPAYCESHHIDLYSEGGRTDIDRGVLLCAFHHMNLHHHGWRITREGTGPFILHPPGGDDPIVLAPPIERRYVYGGLQPPPRRFRPVA